MSLSIGIDYRTNGIYGFFRGGKVFSAEVFQSDSEYQLVARLPVESRVIESESSYIRFSVGEHEVEVMLIERDKGKIGPFEAQTNMQINTSATREDLKIVRGDLVDSGVRRYVKKYGTMPLGEKFDSITQRKREKVV